MHAQHIHRALNRARNRLWAGRLLKQGSVCLAAGALTAAAWVCALRLAWLAGQESTAFWVTGAASALALAVWFLRTRETRTDAAREIDRRGEYKERFITAAELLTSSNSAATRSNLFAQAMLAETDAAARKARLSSLVRIQLPRTAALAVMGLAALGLVWWMLPQAAVAHQSPPAAATTPQQAQTNEQLRNELAQLRDQLRRSGQPLEEIDLLKAFEDALQNADRDEQALRDAAVAAIDQVREQIARGTDATRTAQATREAMRGLTEAQPSADAAVKSLAEALARGDFEAAREALKQIEEETLAREEPEASPASQPSPEELADRQKQKEDLARQLDQLSKKLDQLAREQSDAMKEQAQQQTAATDPQAAERMLDALRKSDLDQVRQELERAGMSQQDIQNLIEQAKAVAGSAEQMERLAEALRKAADQARQDGAESSGLAEAGEMLSEMEALAEQLREMQLALDNAGRAMEQIAQNMPGNPDCDGKGGSIPGESISGSGGAGNAHNPGEISPVSLDAQTRAEQILRRASEARAISRVFIDNPTPPIGEAKAAIRQVSLPAEQQAAAAVDAGKVPRRYQSAVRDYFRDLEDAPQPAQAPPSQP